MLPSNKFDVAAIAQIERMHADLIEPHLTELLTWLQDGNWPVAKPLSTVLAKLGEQVAPSVLEILQGTDSTWKYWCIELLVKQMPSSVIIGMQPQLLALSQSPSVEDEQEGVHVVAREVLKEIP